MKALIYSSALFSFKYEVKKSGTDIDFIDTDVSICTSVLPSFGGRNHILRLRHIVIPLGDAYHEGFSINTTGCIELLFKDEVVANGHDLFIVLYDGATQLVKLFWDLSAYNLYYDRGAGNVLIYNGSSSEWLIISIRVDIDAGVNGQFDCYVYDSTYTELANITGIEFENNATKVDKIRLKSDGGSAGTDYWFGCFGITGERNYIQGDIQYAIRDISSDITDIEITEEMGMASFAEMKIKGESLNRFQAGNEIEIYDSDDVLSWTGRILYPENVLEGTKVVGKLKAIGFNSQFNNAYRKNFTTARSSDYIIKNIIDNTLRKYYFYDDEIDDFALTYKYDLKTKIQKMLNYLMMLERAVIHYKPDGEMFFNKYDNLTASGLSWNQNTTNVKITSYTPSANRHITRAPVIGANNDLGQVYYVGKASDAVEQKYGINQLQPWRDSEITNYTEAKQLGDNLLAIYSMDTQMISLLTVGKGHVQVGYTIQFAWTGVFSITLAHFLVTKRVWYPIPDILELELTDNILTRKAFNVRVINKFYDEDAQQSFEAPDVSESTADGTVLSLHSVAELRAMTWMASGTYTGNGANNHQITGFGFTPKTIIIHRFHYGGYIYLKQASDDEWSCYHIPDCAVVTNSIKFINGGIEVDNGDDSLNKNGIAHHYTAWG